MPGYLPDTRVRPPAVAGLFYPQDPVRLQSEVLELLGGVAPASKVIPKALIALHAGYVYSGRVAAAAFAKLRASVQTVTRVVLIGPHTTFIWVGLLFPGSRPSKLPWAVCAWTPKHAAI